MQIRDAKASVCGGFIGEPMRNTARAERELFRADGFEPFNIVSKSTPIAPRDSQLNCALAKYLALPDNRERHKARQRICARNLRASKSDSRILKYETDVLHSGSPALV
jgi:hypothetical protein